MDFLGDTSYFVLLISHIVIVVAAVGVVTVNDYLHLTGLRNKIREKKLLFVYPILGNAIIYFIILALITGGILLANKPELLSSELFRLKMALFAVIVLNGFLLHKYVFPNLKACILKGGEINCSREVLLISAFSGSVSLASWYGILILAMTKSIGYSTVQFLTVYVIPIAFFFLSALYAETRARDWEDII